MIHIGCTRLSLWVLRIWFPKPSTLGLSLSCRFATKTVHLDAVGSARSANVTTGACLDILFACVCAVVCYVCCSCQVGFHMVPQLFCCFFIVFLWFVEVDSGWNHDHSRQARSGGVIVYRQECLGCAERHPKCSKASINIGALRRWSLTHSQSFSNRDGRVKPTTNLPFLSFSSYYLCLTSFLHISSMFKHGWRYPRPTLSQLFHALWVLGSQLPKASCSTAGTLGGLPCGASAVLSTVWFCVLHGRSWEPIYRFFSPSFPENSSTESSFSLKHFALSKRTIGSKAKQTLQWTHGVVSENCPVWSGCLFRWLFLMGPFYFVFLSLLSMSYIVSLLSLLSISHKYII